MSAARPTRVRPAAVAGAFYPAEPGELRAAVERSFGGAHPGEPGVPAPKALVVPHAGYPYSGPVAASAYLRLAAGRGTIRRVVLIGPSHRVAFRGVAVSSADVFRTPLGDIPVDDESRRLALATPAAVLDDQPHALEHSLEVQLPFLQTVLDGGGSDSDGPDGFSVLPLVTGACRDDEVAEVLDAVWGGPETVVVVSTDLSHYHRYADAVELDRRTAGAIVAGQVDGIDDRDACGASGLRGLLVAAGERQMPAELLDLRNSGDTAGDRERVVGYGAFAFT